MFCILFSSIPADYEMRFFIQQRNIQRDRNFLHTHTIEKTIFKQIKRVTLATNTSCWRCQFGVLKIMHFIYEIILGDKIQLGFGQLIGHFTIYYRFINCVLAF